MFSVWFAFAYFTFAFAQPREDVIDFSHLGLAIFGKPVVIDKMLTVDELTNAEELGSYVEGDLLVPQLRNGMKMESLRWKDGEVPFVIQGNFSKFATFSTSKKRVQLNYFCRCIQHGHD